MWSFARQQKHDFCPRAFYFRYNELDESFSQDLEAEILYRRSVDFQTISQYYFPANLAKEVFYLRPESGYLLRKMVFREGKKLEIEEDKIDETIIRLEEFRESDFYLKTNPSLVNHLHIESHPSINVGEREVAGLVHLAWIDPSAKLNIVKISNKEKESDISFPVLYAMKKFQAGPEKINAGTLSAQTWECNWQPVDWHRISELQDKALSFELSEDVSEFKPTQHESRCQICTYSSVCRDHTSELDLY